jgi:hypothetical protein
MSPDFVYFLRLHPSGHFGHTLPGLFLFCLPLGLAMFWLFHTLLERPLHDILPTRLAQPVTPAPWSWSRVGAVTLSLLLGASTHIVWDAFTHADGWGVTQLSWLHWQLFPESLALPLYKVAQHGSSLVGMVTILIWLYRRQHPPHISRYAVRTRAGVWLLLLGGSGTASFFYSYAQAPESFRAFLGTFVVTSVSSLFVALTL